MRAHADVEDHIQRLKESGLNRFPFTNFEANANWLMTVAMAADLVRWFQLLCLEGRWRDARPKALRWEIFHAPGRIVRSARRDIVRLLEGWPTAGSYLAPINALPYSPDANQNRWRVTHEGAVPLQRRSRVILHGRNSSAERSTALAGLSNIFQRRGPLKTEETMLDGPVMND
jgi:hypothetical protein